MTLEQRQKVTDADAREHDLFVQLTVAREVVVSTTNAIPEKKCAAQNVLCGAILTLEKTKKERLIEQMQADVESMTAKLNFLDNHVVLKIDIYERLMITGVNLVELALLNQQDEIEEE